MSTNSNKMSENLLKINGRPKQNYVEADELQNFIGKTVLLCGYIYKIRLMSDFAFVILRTKGSLIQCVYSPDYSEFRISELKENMCVVIKGEVIKEERSRTGLEIRLVGYEPLSCPTEEAPVVVINNKEVAAAFETLLDYRPITLRNAKERAIFKLQAGICEGFRDFFRRNKFTEIHTPKIVYRGAEGGSNIFKIDYSEEKRILLKALSFISK